MADDSVLPNFLSWNPPKTAVAVCSLKFNCGTGWLRVISIFACLVIGRNDARVGEEFGVGIFVERAQRDRHLRHRKDGELSKRRVSQDCRRSC